MNTFANRLISFRENHLGITQKEFCERCKNGVSQQNISQWEKGEGQPNLKKMFIIKTSFPELDTDWLLTGEGDMLNKLNTTPKEHRLFSEDYWKEKTRHLEDKIRLQEDLIAELKRRK